MQPLTHITDPPIDTTPGRRRYGPSHQMPRRGIERKARRAAVLLRRWARTVGWRARQIAASLGVCDRTLRHWNQRWRTDRLEARPLGRPVKPSPPHRRNALIESVRREGVQLGVRSHWAAFPDMARREVENIVGRCKDLDAERRRIATQRLRWTTPGTVWAMDHTQPSDPVDGVYESVFAVHDLASGAQLAWHPLLRETAHYTIEVLETLFLLYGAPLVIKADNGSPFISAEMRQLLDRWQVTLLLSPPRTPRYNGSREAGIGWLAVRTDHFAACRVGGYHAPWTTPDMHAALHQANHRVYPLGPNGPTHWQLFEARSTITQDQRDAFADTLMRVRNASKTETHEQPDGSAPRYTRSEVEQALVQSHLLVITRRRITPLLKNFFAAKIT